MNNLKLQQLLENQNPQTPPWKISVSNWKVENRKGHSEVTRSHWKGPKVRWATIPWMNTHPSQIPRILSFCNRYIHWSFFTRDQSLSWKRYDTQKSKITPNHRIKLLNRSIEVTVNRAVQIETQRPEDVLEGLSPSEPGRLLRANARTFDKRQQSN